MPKKQKNAFYFFMKDHKDRYAAIGKRVSMKEVANECHPLYKNLSLKEKERYEQMAKDYKNQVRDTLEGKLCSDGTVLSLNLQAEQEKWEIMENETKAIERMIFNMGSVDEVADKTFYIVCFNVLCCTDEEDYIPNEVGVVKYSIRLGIEESYHCFIDPGAIPLGYTHASKQHSEDTHAIPISGFEQADRNYKKICKSILDIVNPACDTVAPVFCLNESLLQNQGCLQWLSFKAGHLAMESIHFYDLTCLLMELRAYVDHAFPSRTIAVDILSNRAFDYTQHTRCNYHEDLDNAYCALGCAKRVCFILSDALCSLYDVDCTPNHLPPRVGDTIQLDVSQPSFPSSRTFICPKSPQQYSVPIRAPKSCSNLIGNDDDKSFKNSDIDYAARPWMRDFHQFQQNISFCKNDVSSLNVGKTNKPEEMRQPSTVPLVLNHAAFPLKPQFALLGRGRGIGRGKQPSVDLN